MEQNQKNSPVARALRGAGYIPLPRLWVKGDDMPTILAIAHQHQHEISTIRHKAKGLGMDQPDPSWLPSKYLPNEQIWKDPAEDKDAAWDAYERARNAK